MNNKILFRVLQLDSIFGLLDWSDRAYIHLWILGKNKITTPKREFLKILKQNFSDENVN